jgi:hypothetical protein
VNAAVARQLDAAIAAAIDRDRAWLPHDRRGRWVVMEPGTGRLLRGSPAHVRRVADAATPRRARRFSSLSRARAFARRVGGDVHRWRRTTPFGGVWHRLDPWDRARATADAATWLPGIVGGAE